MSANSYLAVVRVLDIAQRTGATLSLRPVSPTLFQELTHAPPPPVFTGNKAAVLKADFDRYAARWNLILKEIVNAEATEKALRVIQATQESARPRLVMAILQGFHTGIADIEDVETLKRMAYGILDADQVGKAVESDSIAHGELDRTTEELATHFGALGVPAFWVPDPKLKPELKGVGFADGGQIHMGHDRLHVGCSYSGPWWFASRSHVVQNLQFVESQLRLNADPSSTTPVPMPRIALGPLKNHTTLTFWFDFSSPWTYLGYTQLKRIMAEAGPYLKVILKPTLLGIVFKSIGTPVVPTAVATKARQEWQQVELKRWADYWSAKPFKGGKAVRFKWSDHFPLRTPLALRMVCGAISKGWKEEELFKLCDTICGS